MYPLALGLRIDKTISLVEFKKMKAFMEAHDIWRYKIKQKDFYRVRDGKKIVAFWRLFKIWFQEWELWSIWVDEVYRGKKLWLLISQELIADRKKNNDIFLATRRPLGKYYEQIGFQIIEKNIPGKLVHTINRAISQNIDFIIMKLV